MEECNIRFIPFPTDGEKTIVRADCVLFCRSDGEYTRAMLSDGSVVEIRCCLNSMEEMLVSCGFFRCHELYMVNGNLVKEFFADNNKRYARVHLDTNVPISMSYYSNFQDSLMTLLR